jgi:ubiquinone biosynthesis protein
MDNVYRLPEALTRETGAGALALDLRRLLAVAAAALRIVGLADRLRPGRVTRPRGERVRVAFERLGLTYLKLGQFLAMRFDLLPRDVCDELNKLFERVAPVAFDDLRELIESELERPIDQVFSSFEETPIASASVGQVHRAVTVDGRRVAVKVQRPGIERVFAADMRNLWRTARILDRFGALGHLSAKEVTYEFMTWTAGELDFVAEAATADRLRRDALAYETVPKLHWDLITRRVLTMELIDGLSLNEVTNLLARGGEELLEEHLPGIDMPLVMERFVNASLRQIFINGFFHGDPHPGNILVCSDNTVAFVDFGIFGRLNPYYLSLMVGMVESVAIGDVDVAFRSYLAIADASDETDIAAFESAAKKVIRRWYQSASGDAPAADRHLGKYVGEMLELVRRHRLRMNWDTLLFWRTLHALDTSALKLPQYVDLLAQLRTFFVDFAPTPSERVEKVLIDPDRTMRILSLQRNAPRYFASIRTAIEGSLPWRPDVDEDHRERRRRDRSTKALSAATLGVSSTLLATSPAVAGGLQVGMAVAAPALFLTALGKSRA